MRLRTSPCDAVSPGAATWSTHLRPLTGALVVVALFAQGCRCSEPPRTPTPAAEARIGQPQSAQRPVARPVSGPDAAGLAAAATNADAGGHAADVTQLPAAATWSLDVVRPEVPAWPPQTLADALILAQRAHAHGRRALPEGGAARAATGAAGAAIVLVAGRDRVWTRPLPRGAGIALTFPSQQLRVVLAGGRCHLEPLGPLGRDAANHAACDSAVRTWASVALAVWSTATSMAAPTRALRFRADRQSASVDLFDPRSRLRWTAVLSPRGLTRLEVATPGGAVPVTVVAGGWRWSGSRRDATGERRPVAWQVAARAASDGAPAEDVASLQVVPTTLAKVEAAYERALVQARQHPSPAGKSAALGPGQLVGTWDGRRLTVSALRVRIVGASGAAGQPVALKPAVRAVRVRSPSFDAVLKGLAPGPVVLQLLGSAADGSPGHVVLVHR